MTKKTKKYSGYALCVFRKQIIGDAYPDLIYSEDMQNNCGWNFSVLRMIKHKNDVVKRVKITVVED